MSSCASCTWEAQQFIVTEQIISTVTRLRSKECLHLSLHSIILSLFVNLFNSSSTPRSCKTLMSQEIVDFLFHSGLLILRHDLVSVLGCEGSFCLRLAGSFLGKLRLCGTRSDISRQLKPSKILWPSVDIELEFESHVRR